jgi:hypothetical protein
LAAVHAVQPLSISSEEVGRLAGAPKMPMSSPMCWSSMVSCEISVGSASEPRMSLALVELMTGRRSGCSLSTVIT